MLRLPPLPPPVFPVPSAEALDDFGVEGACRFELLDEGEDGGVELALFALASRAAFWLLRPNGDSAAADARLLAGDGMAKRLSQLDQPAYVRQRRVILVWMVALSAVSEHPSSGVNHECTKF